MPKLIYRPDFRDKAKLAKQQRPVARKNKDGSKSTHLYEYGQFDNKFVVYPTIFPKSAKSTSNPKDWIELDSDKAYDEARRRGEVIEFNDEHSAKGFSAGAWKDVVDDSSTGSVVNSPLKKKYQSGRGNISKYHLQSLFSNGGKVAAKKNTFPYTPPQKPASGKLEYVPLVETLTGVDRIGGGLFSKAAGKLIKKGADYARNYVRLKTNPTSAYRMLGTKGHKSAKKEGFLTPSPYDKSLGKTHTKTAYSIGSPADGKYNKFHRKYEGPYMVEVKNATTNPKFHKTLSDKEAYTAPVSPEKYGGGGGHIPISEAILWKKTPLGGYRKVKFANGGKIATKTNPSLWEKAKAQAKARMGGKHSARAMQLAVSIYKKAGGGYKGPKKETGLSKWTKQDWTTSSGKPSEGKRRYLPRKAWSALSSAEKAATNRAKAEGNKQGKQFVAQPKTIAKKVVKYRR
jgi:hypothetical protein